MSNDKQKIKFGANPETFDKEVEIVLVDGRVATLNITYIYRTRSQFAALMDEDIAAIAADPSDAKSTAKKGSAEPKPITVKEIFAKSDAGGADYVLKIAKGWDLDDAFEKQSLLRLEDENPGALAAIASRYRAAVAEARTKN